MLVCAMNPCRCGWYGDPSRAVHLLAGRGADRIFRRISGPLLDRIDIIIGGAVARL